MLQSSGVYDGITTKENNCCRAVLKIKRRTKMQMLTEYTHYQITKIETELRGRKNEAHSRNGIASRSFLSLSQKTISSLLSLFMQ